MVHENFFSSNCAFNLIVETLVSDWCWDKKGGRELKIVIY